MSSLSRALVLAPLFVTILCAQPALTLAQSTAGGGAYPARPVRLVVPFPPGASPNDIIGRLLARPVGDSLGQQVVVDKSRPGQINFSSGGSGTVPHFAGEMLNSMAGIRMNHVPYKGGAPASAALLGGEVSVYIDTPTAMMPFAKQGKVRALAVTEKKRFALFPDVPTLDESGVPGYEMRVWYGFFAPAKTPKPIIARLHAETLKALKTEEVRSRLATLGTEPVGSGPEIFQPLVRGELRKWAKVAREAGIKAE